MNELQVVVKQEVGKINWNFEELKTALATEMKKYTGIVFDDDSIADAKKTVAYLRKLKESVEDRRKDVKKKCLEPYNEMEKQAKELTQLRRRSWRHCRLDKGKQGQERVSGQCGGDAERS